MGIIWVSVPRHPHDLNILLSIIGIGCFPSSQIIKIYNNNIGEYPTHIYIYIYIYSCLSVMSPCFDA